MLSKELSVNLLMDEDLSQFGDVVDLFERYPDVAGNTEHPRYSIFIAELIAFVKASHADAAEALGEEFSRPGTGYNAEEAYKWYYIGLSQQGYSVDWEDQNHEPPYYCGPVGDFRNESMVCELVVEIGWERVQELDREAEEWMTKHGLSKK